VSGDPPFSKIALLGPGLLGGSLALALRERLREAHLRVWGRREEPVQAVWDRGIADVASTDLEAVVGGADLAVLCVPVDSMADLLKRMLPFLRPSAMVTDVGSVKRPVVESLFEGAVCLITPAEGTPAADIAAVTLFWEIVGCRVRRLSPAEHDDVVALVSHLPHLLAAALTQFAAERKPGALELCGNGFKDTTRVASGPPAMWTGILRENRRALHDSLEALIEKLSGIATLLDQFDDTKMMRLLEAAKAHRDRLKDSR
jgi:prephenate dehydrogenase